MTRTARIGGPMLRAGYEGCDDAVLVWNGIVAQFPTPALQPTSTQDIAAAMGFARRESERPSSSSNRQGTKTARSSPSRLAKGWCTATRTSVQATSPL
jgi:hypothetical protein